MTHDPTKRLNQLALQAFVSEFGPSESTDTPRAQLWIEGFEAGAAAVAKIWKEASEAGLEVDW